MESWKVRLLKRLLESDISFKIGFKENTSTYGLLLCVFGRIPDFPFQKGLTSFAYSPRRCMY